MMIWSVLRYVLIVGAMLVLGLGWQLAFLGTPYFPLGSLCILAGFAYAAIRPLVGIAHWWQHRG